MNKPELRVDREMTSYGFHDGPAGNIRTASTETFLSLFSPDEMFPTQLRWHDPIQNVFVLEIPPYYQMITRRARTRYSYHRAEQNHEGGTFLIPLPWQVYICVLHPDYAQIYFYTRTEQLQSLDDDINYQHMPNVYTTGEPCRGAQGVVNLERPIETCFNLISNIWLTDFSGGGYNIDGEQAPKEFYPPKGSLQPKELVEAGFSDHFWAPSYMHEFLEEQTIEDILGWEWVKAAPLRQVIKWAMRNSASQKRFAHLNRLMVAAQRREKEHAEANTA